MAGGDARDAQLTPTAPGEAIQATVTSGQSPAYTESSGTLLTNMGSKKRKRKRKRKRLLIFRQKKHEFDWL